MIFMIFGQQTGRGIKCCSRVTYKTVSTRNELCNIQLPSKGVKEGMHVSNWQTTKPANLNTEIITDVERQLWSYKIMQIYSTQSPSSNWHYILDWTLIFKHSSRLQFRFVPIMNWLCIKKSHCNHQKIITKNFIKDYDKPLTEESFTITPNFHHYCRYQDLWNAASCMC